ncbi:hypothetical protein [Candidatus Magnetominusculus dajiuhuensis]|uniref:hypothetical protein n=1 Tax=Candidatus Magnetominusculus dajiuhuensis TaxID=3137712 RepID=UPI003B42E529
MNKIVRAVVLVLLFSATFPFRVYAAESSFTQQDRERLIHLEEGLKATNQRIEEGLKATNQRIEDMSKATNQRIEDTSKATNQRMDDGFKAINQRIDDLNRRMGDVHGRMSDLFGLMYVLIGGMLTLMGFVLWDRRTTLAPVVRKNRELEDRAEKIEKAFKELALKDPNAAEALKHSGL